MPKTTVPADVCFRAYRVNLTATELHNAVSTWGGTETELRGVLDYVRERARVVPGAIWIICAISRTFVRSAVAVVVSDGSGKVRTITINSERSNG